MLVAALLLSVLALVNGQNLEVNDYQEFMDYIGSGYRGVIVGTDETSTLMFSVIYGTRMVGDGIDTAFSSRYILTPEAKVTIQSVKLNVDNTVVATTTTLSLPNFQVENVQTNTLTVGQGASLYVVAANAPMPEVYSDYESIKAAIKSGKQLGTFFNGAECADVHPELAGMAAVSPNLDTRIGNEGMASEYIEVVSSTIEMLDEARAGEVWRTVIMLPDGHVVSRRGSFDPIQGDMEHVEYVCSLGSAWSMKEMAGFPNGGRRIETFEDMKDQLLRGLPTAMVFDTTECEIMGDDDIIGTNTIVQSRAINNWQWFAETPGGGEGIQANTFSFGGANDVLGQEPYIVHQNVDIDVDNAYVHISLIDLMSQTWSTTLLVCGLGTGAWMESKAEGERTQLTTVQEVVDSALLGQTMAISVDLEACGMGNAILGTSVIHSYGEDGAVFVVNDYNMRLMPAVFEGFAIASYRATLAEDGTLTLKTALNDAGDWTEISGETITCPFSAAVVWR